MVKISVIIPINHDSYENTLESIISQTFQDIEIICLLNSKSGDISIEDNRITVKTTDNLINAINKEINEIKGEYLYITDTSNVLEYNALEVLYERINVTGHDFVASDINVHESDATVWYKKSFDNVYEDELTYTTVPDLINVYASSANKLFSTGFIRKNNILFDYGDEKSFVYDSIFKAKNISYVQEALVNYYNERFKKINNNALMGVSDFSNNLIKLFKENNLFDEYKDRLYNHKMYLLTEGLQRIDIEYKEKYFNIIREDLKKILLDNNISNDFVDNISSYYHKIFEGIIISETYYEYELLKKTYYEMNDYYNLLDERNFYKKAQEKKIEKEE